MLVGGKFRDRVILGDMIDLRKREWDWESWFFIKVLYLV